MSAYLLINLTTTDVNRLLKTRTHKTVEFALSFISTNIYDISTELHNVNEIEGGNTTFTYYF